MHYQLRIESIHQHCYLKTFLLPIRNAKKKSKRSGPKNSSCGTRAIISDHKL